MTTIQPIPTPRKPWVNIIVGLLYFLLYEVIHYVFAIGARLYFIAVYPDPVTREVAFNDSSNFLMIILDVIVLLTLSVIVLARGKRYFDGMGVRKSRWETLPVAFVAGIGLSCLLGFIMNFVGSLFPEIMEDYSQTMDTTYNMSQVVFYALAAVIGAPLVEELIFRHFVAGRMARGMPRFAAIAASSLLFGIVHQHIVQVIYAALLGIVMACIYFAYDSVLPSIALHAGFNAVSLVSMIDVSGLSETNQIRFSIILTVVYLVLSFFGVGAYALLMVRCTHPIWKGDPKEDPAPAQAVEVIALRPAAVKWERLMAMPMERGKFPTVADLSANMTDRGDNGESAKPLGEPADAQTPRSADDGTKEAEE